MRVSISFFPMHVEERQETRCVMLGTVMLGIVRGVCANLCHSSKLTDYSGSYTGAVILCFHRDMPSREENA